MDDIETYVSLAQARRLKHLGFDWKLRQYLRVRDDGEVSMCYGNLPDNWNREGYQTQEIDCITAPTIHTAQRWLREVKNIHIIIGRTRKPEPTFYYRIEEMTDDGYSTMPYGGYASYELALSDALDHTMNLLLEIPCKFKGQKR